MRRQSVLWSVFESRFEDALDRFRRRRLSAEEAGELLGVSGRQFRRLCVRFDSEGLEGLRDRRLGRASPRRAEAAEIGRMCDLYPDRYRDFTVRHFHEALMRDHGYRLCYTVTRLALQSAGLVREATLRGKHRKKRERRPLPGMLVFQDGSTHCWLPETDAQQDLIVTLDDATGHITSIFLTGQEGTMSSFQGIAETIREHGLFGAFYTDRGSHYFLTQVTGGKVDKQNLTQVGRALAQLGIRHIPSYSPEARGRMAAKAGKPRARVNSEKPVTFRMAPRRSVRRRADAVAEIAGRHLQHGYASTEDGLQREDLPRRHATASEKRHDHRHDRHTHPAEAEGVDLPQLPRDLGGSAKHRRVRAYASQFRRMIELTPGRPLVSCDHDSACPAPTKPRSGQGFWAFRRALRVHDKLVTG